MYLSKSAVFVTIFANLAVSSNSFKGCKPAGLNFAAKVNGNKYFGAAVGVDLIANQQARSILDNSADFGQITPENAMKWDQTEPARNGFDFTEGDRIADYARSHNKVLRCHTLVWHQALPSWVTSGSFDSETLRKIMVNHISAVVQHFRGRCYAWDVLNEAVNDDGSYRVNPFYTAMGESYIPTAFAAAAATDPDAKLYYNDYNLENSANNAKKIEAVKKMVDMIRAKGAKIDGVGLQSHFQSDILVLSVDLFAKAMNAFVDKGLEVAITELDAAIGLPPTPDALQKQQWQYTNAVKACRKVNRCVGVTTWNFSDKYYFNYSGGNVGSALPWDYQLAKKMDVYNSIMYGWGGHGGWDGWNGRPTCK